MALKSTKELDKRIIGHQFNIDSIATIVKLKIYNSNLKHFLEPTSEEILLILPPLERCHLNGANEPI